MKEKNFRSNCPISQILDIIGDKWTILIIRDIAYFQKHTFNEFLQSDERMASNILSNRLNKLEAAGLIVKKQHPDSKAKIYYGLSRKGVDLIPILFEMAIWSDKYLNIDKDAKPFIQSIKNNRDSVFKGLVKSHITDLK